MSAYTALPLCAVIAYLLGSISTGVLFSKHLGRDIRTAGSKNAGATNMTRVHGLRNGAITFGGDCLKGILAALIGRALFGQTGAMVAAVFAVIGHNWPVFFGFRGGKGVATCIGIGLVTYPPFGALAAVVGVIVMLLSRFVSLGSLIGVSFFAVAVTIRYGFWPVGAWAILLDLMVIWRHWENIQRLLSHTERKIGEKA